MSCACDSHDTKAQAVKPWWRQLWPWLLIAGPAVTLVGCIITIILAVQNFGDQAMTDGAVKRGLKVERVVVAPDDNALNNRSGERR